MKLEEAAQILGVHPDTPIETLKQTYRRLALAWHPDKVKGRRRHRHRHRRQTPRTPQPHQSPQRSHHLAVSALHVHHTHAFSRSMYLVHFSHTVAISAPIPTPRKSFSRFPSLIQSLYQHSPWVVNAWKMKMTRTGRTNAGTSRMRWRRLCACLWTWSGYSTRTTRCRKTVRTRVTKLVVVVDIVVAFFTTPLPLTLSSSSVYFFSFFFPCSGRVVRHDVRCAAGARGLVHRGA